jgi:hypothetical protein
MTHRAGRLTFVEADRATGIIVRRLATITISQAATRLAHSGRGSLTFALCTANQDLKACVMTKSNSQETL